MEEALHTLLPEYLQNQLPGPDRRRVEQRAATDRGFADELAFFEKAARAVREAEYLRLKNILREEDRLLQKANQPVARPVQKEVGRVVPMFGRAARYAAAAALVGLAFAGWWMFVREKPEKVFATEFRPYENVIGNEYGLIERGDPAASTEVGRAFNLLKGKDYPAAAAAFESLAASKNDPRFQFWQAQALAADGRTAAALDLFEKFASDPKSPFRAAAHWYAALAHLRNGDEANARNWLEKISADPALSEKKAEAEALLKKLE